MVGSAGVLVSVVAGWMLARTALHPIDRLQVADAIGASGNWPAGTGGRTATDEIGRLSMAFNRMLGELQGAHETVAGALVAQRRFVADASHELRTPLATLRGNVDLLRQMLADAGDSDTAETVILDDVSRPGRANELSGGRPVAVGPGRHRAAPDTTPDRPDAGGPWCRTRPPACCAKMCG